MKELKEIQELNREIFNLFELLFKEGFGMSPQRFSSIDNFSSSIRKSAHKIAKSTGIAIKKYEPLIRKFYINKSDRLFELLKNSGGLKYVLGGSSYFLPTHFRTVKSMALYGDTILIPDPVLPWLEIDRNTERFRHVQFLEQIFMLLHLKPLVDAELPYPAVSIFPSWEKSLEKYDSQTKENIEKLITNFYSFYFQIPFINYMEIIDYLNKHPDDYLKQVDSNNLYIAPEGVKETIDDSIKHYREYINTWRSDDYKKKLNNLSNAELVWIGINERLAPQFHLWENSNELKAHPLSCVDSQWHYHQLTSSMLYGITNSINTKILNPIDSYVQLNNKRFEWLGNLTIKELVKLRKDGENEEFRSEIKKALDHLNSSSIQDVSTVSAEVAKVISNILYKHQRNIKKIRDRYINKYSETLFFTGAGIAASFIPIVAPVLIPATAIGAGLKIVWDIKGHIGSLKKESRSLMGIFAKYSKTP